MSDILSDPTIPSFEFKRKYRLEYGNPTIPLSVWGDDLFFPSGGFSPFVDVI